MGSSLSLSLPLTQVLLGAAAGAGKRGRTFENRPAAFAAGLDLLAEHTSDHRSASLSAARAGSGAGATAYHLESLCPGLNSFHDDALSDLVAQANRTVGVDDRLLTGFL